MSRKKQQALGPVGTATGLFLLSALAIACACLAILGVKLANAPVLQVEPLFPLAAYAVGVPLSLLWLKLSGWKGDAGLVGAVFLLCGIGLVIQFRMGSFSQGLAKPRPCCPSRSDWPHL